MPRSAGVSVENSFVNGLITQASAFNFPENAVTDCDNVVFDERGIVSRRFGFDFETEYQTKTIARASSAVAQFVWRSAAGNGDTSFYVLQIGTLIYFYRISEDAALSAGAVTGTIDLSDHNLAGTSGTGTIECQFAAGYGRLFITHPHVDPLFVSYDIDTETFTETSITILMRDTEGVDSPYSSNSSRPPSPIPSSHLYNLRNQGWPEDKVAQFFGLVGSYPSNADVWWLFKSAEDRFLQSQQFGTDGDVFYEDDGTLATTQLRGNSPAPKGSMILEAFNQDRDAAAGTTGVPDVTNTTRPSCVSFFAGRVFYGGTEGEGFNNRIYFTQIVENVRQLNYCYQENDPTSEFSFDLLATDGGVIVIPEAGTIVRMVPFNSTLVVFASNGIWTIGGSEGTGFKANDYSVQKVSTIECLSGSSFVDIAGSPCWWNTDGIYIISAGQMGNVEVQSLTETKVRSFFEDIPYDSKKYVKGYFNTVKKTIHWVYRSTSPTTVDERYEYDRVLCFNTLSGAFYPFSYDTSAVKVLGVVSVEGLNPDGIPVSASFKYLCSQGSEVTFAETIENGEFIDWLSSAAGVYFLSYFTTGYKVRGEGLRKFQTNYVRFISVGTDPSSYYVQGIWDWASSPDTGRFSSRQRITHTSDGYGTQHRKVKLRGHGVACQFKVTSIEGEPFDLLGWVALETANNNA